MTEFNVYIVDLLTNKNIYLYTTLADNEFTDLHIEFYKQEFGINRAAFHIIPTEDDNRCRDELIFDYIIEKDDSTSTASSEQ